MTTADPEKIDSTITVEVAYALPQHQEIISLTVEAGTTVLEAARRSGIAAHFHDLELGEATRFGIFGQVVPAAQPLRDGDRVEIYRPLIADPKEARRARAAKVKARRSGDEAAPSGENEPAREPEGDGET
jgi:putative ubiquitin-RnfH superfamily antitoxin RatB of RatAB toxin-antitoxin module